jgi:hypothetical protein
MHYFAFLAFLTHTIAAPSPQISDIPSLLSGIVGNTEPPLMTIVHSPECKDLNDGTAMCCDAQLDGGNPLVQSLAALAHYPLTKDTINGITCMFPFSVCV